MIGSKNSELSANLALAKDFFDNAEQFSSDRKAYSEFMMSSTQLYKEALKQNNCDEILLLEEVSQENEFRHDTSPNSQEKKLSFLNGLKAIKDFWEESKDPEKIRERFKYDNIEVGNNKVKSGIVDSYIKSHSKKMFEYIGDNAVPAEKYYYGVRKEAMQFVHKEIQKNIDKALGYERGKGKVLER